MTRARHDSGCSCGFLSGRTTQRRAWRMPGQFMAGSAAGHAAMSATDQAGSPVGVTRLAVQRRSVASGLDERTRLGEVAVGAHPCLGDVRRPSQSRWPPGRAPTPVRSQECENIVPEFPRWTNGGQRAPAPRHLRPSTSNCRSSIISVLGLAGSAFRRRTCVRALSFASLIVGLIAVSSAAHAEDDITTRSARCATP